jgi:hypothetical protein
MGWTEHAQERRKTWWRIGYPEDLAIDRKIILTYMFKKISRGGRVLGSHDLV